MPKQCPSEPSKKFMILLGVLKGPKPWPGPWARPPSPGPGPGPGPQALGWALGSWHPAALIHRSIGPWKERIAQSGRILEKL